MEHFKVTGNLLTISFSGENDGKNHNVSRRGIVDDFSKSSSSRMSRYLRSCTSVYKYFHTLTYPKDQSTWINYRAHFRAIIERARRAGYIGQDDSIFWFVEYQRRGAPHYHLFSTCHIGKVWLSQNWFEVVGSGDRKHLVAGTNTQRIRGGRDALRSYCRKYAAKNEQKTLPDMFKAENRAKSQDGSVCGARWWGVVGCRKVVVASTSLRSNNSAASVDISFKNELDNCINTAIKYERVKFFSYMEARCFEFKDERTARYVYYLIQRHRELKLCQLNAHISQIVKESVVGQKKRSLGWDVKQYQRAKAILR